MITVSQLFWFIIVALVAHLLDFIPKDKGRGWITTFVLVLRILWAIFLLGMNVWATLLLVVFEMSIVVITSICIASTMSQKERSNARKRFLKSGN
ncbi:hypothetical protein HBP99_14530 [Listeria booriae]|uniref:Uncharacterized protein n=1 Tax=Listeria booriae TaxID=1552123 RepID=A0A7X0Z8Q2_9LIST|nr:hypothetical protein [Listeria booriae]MBC2178035.1 hypothetical protein [Listeria booriae]MBC2369842.1 hypothetical protein [Listeria booriae]